MTENEAIEAIQFDLEIGGEIHSQVLRDAVDVAIRALGKVQQYRAIGTPEELQDMKSNYFEALSDWRQYRKIGTVEECRTAREKQIPKKVQLRHVRKFDGFDDGECSTCGQSVSRDCDGTDNFCPNCGQKLDWSDEE